MNTGEQIYQNIVCTYTTYFHFRKGEVERLKEKDILEEMLREITRDFPGLSQALIKERDLFLAHSIRSSAKLLPNPNTETG